jgi:quercetin dioxygenase-like cupin family protein
MNIAKAESLATFSSDKYAKIPINGTGGLLRLLCFESGQGVLMHKHPKGDEYFYVIEGKGKITIGEEEAEAGPGSIIKAPSGVPHQWKNGDQRLVLLSILIPFQSYKVADEVAKMQFT